MRSRFFFLLFAAAVLSACGNNPPELKQIYNQVNFVKSPGSEEVRAELLVLVSADDEDGDDDIASLHVIRDSDEYSWSVDSQNWSTRDSRGMKWTGYQRFSTVDGKMFEPGEYRVLITDNAGERAEDSIFIPLIRDIPIAEEFAVITFQDENRFTIESPQAKNIISFYDSAGKLLASYSATPGEVRIKTLRDGTALSDNYKTVKIAYYSNTTGAGLISGPYIRPDDEK